jgi:hypothetical protein
LCPHLRYLQAPLGALQGHELSEPGPHVLRQPLVHLLKLQQFHRRHARLPDPYQGVTLPRDLPAEGSDSGDFFLSPDVVTVVVLKQWCASSTAMLYRRTINHTSQYVKLES